MNEALPLWQIIVAALAGQLFAVLGLAMFHWNRTDPNMRGVGIYGFWFVTILSGSILIFVDDLFWQIWSAVTLSGMITAIWMYSMYRVGDADEPGKRPAPWYYYIIAIGVLLFVVAGVYAQMD